MGRIFVVRLQDGDVLNSSIEQLAREEGIERAMLIYLGGARAGSVIIAGPEDSDAIPVKPMEALLEGVHEACGVGTIFPDESGNPVLHLHAAFGRAGDASAGCTRKKVVTWHVGELVLIEITDSTAVRRKDPATGFELVEP